MKYVYVLVSAKTDFYYEQALMSAYSLRMHTPQAHITVLTDNKTFESFAQNRQELKKYVTEIIPVDFSSEVKNVERSRLIKTAIPEYVHGDFLYIDCDTIICDDLSSIEQVPFALGGVKDGHCNLDAHIHQKSFLARDKKLGFTAARTQGFCFNGGLCLARDCEETRALFKKWNELWKYSAYTKHDAHDQNAFNEANVRTGSHIQELPGEWDCQPSHGGLLYLQNAKILHYFSSEFNGKQYVPYYKLADKTLQSRIKESGIIEPDIQEMIKNAKFQFTDVHLIHDKRIVSVMQTPLLFTLADIKAHIPWLFAFFNAQCAALRWLAKKITGRK